MTNLRHFFGSWFQNFPEVTRHSKIFNPELRHRVAFWSRQDLWYSKTNTVSWVRKCDWLGRKVIDS